MDQAPASDSQTARPRIPYDEFSMFHENAAEFGLEWNGPPEVRRQSVGLEDGRQLSSLVWGPDEPEIVFLHGGAQNAHTWDTVLLALGRPALCIDLPGHGHSDGGRAGALGLDDNAADVAAVIGALAPRARAVVGMSLGGLTSLALAGGHPELVRALILVDITPGFSRERSRAITDFVNGPETFPDFDAILARTVQFNPTRTESSLRRGILHNAQQLDDGSWVWRHARHRQSDVAAPPVDMAERAAKLWEVVSGLAVPLMLVRGMRPQSVVGDEDEAEVRRRNPGARVEHVAEAGHSVQGDDPVTLARLINDFVSSR
ncbi:MAG: alpha/beta fold hydrolase [Acidimicrobiales bacterium]